MNTREEAVAYLIERGFQAATRDWVMGETVVVTAEPSQVHEITGYRRVVYLVPKGDGWTGSELDHPRDGDDDIVSLEQACERAVRLLNTPRGPA